jgi:hypothetical protein
MGVQTIDRVLKLPAHATAFASGGRTVANAPLGAGVASVLASNLVHLGREGSKRTLGDHPGWPSAVWETLPATGVFNFDGLEANGVVTWSSGVVRIAAFGEQGRWPKVTATCRGAVPAPYTLGLFLCVTPAALAGDDRSLQPSPGRHPYATTTTTSATFVDLALSVALPGAPSTATAVGVKPLAIIPGQASAGGGPFETGSERVIEVFFGAWCTSAKNTGPGDRASVQGLVVYLDDP